MKAIRRIEAENNRSADTHLYAVPLPEHWGVQMYLKDESTHRSGSLKHRLARSLFLFGLVNGWIKEGTTIVEASSGSTAVSEAYFARLARTTGGHYMDQFTYAESATDWRGNNNIAESVFDQLSLEQHPV